MFSKKEGYDWYLLLQFLKVTILINFIKINQHVNSPFWVLTIPSILFCDNVTGHGIKSININFQHPGFLLSTCLSDTYREKQLNKQQIHIAVRRVFFFIIRTTKSGDCVWYYSLKREDACSCPIYVDWNSIQPKRYNAILRHQNLNKSTSFLPKFFEEKNKEFNFLSHNLLVLAKYYFIYTNFKWYQIFWGTLYFFCYVKCLYYLNLGKNWFCNMKFYHKKGREMRLVLSCSRIIRRQQWKGGGGRTHAQRFYKPAGIFTNLSYYYGASWG